MKRMHRCKTLLTILFLLALSSCTAVRYAENPGAIYYDFGSRAHYYSDTARNVGLELYHGFDVFDSNHPATREDLPKNVRRAMRRTARPCCLCCAIIST